MALHGAARRAAGLELTELEAALVQALRAVADTDEEVLDYGRLYREEDRSVLFPDCLARRPIEEGYGSEDLRRDLPGLSEEIAAQPNLRVIDLDAPEVGAADAAQAQEEFDRAKAAYGYGATVMTASKRALKAYEPQGAAAPLLPLKVKLTMLRFYCSKESNELSGSDELFWVTCAAADEGYKQTRYTRVYGDVDALENHAFDDNSFIFDGTVHESLVATIEAWEKDHGSQKKIHQKLKELEGAFHQTADQLSYLPYKDWNYAQPFLALAGFLVAMIGALVNAMEDDFINDETLTYDRAALWALHEQGNLYIDFNGRKEPGRGEGQYRLTVRSDVSIPPTKLLDMLPGLQTNYDPSQRVRAACAAPGSDEEIWLFQGMNYPKPTLNVPGTHTLMYIDATFDVCGVNA